MTIMVSLVDVGTRFLRPTADYFPDDAVRVLVVVNAFHQTSRPSYPVYEYSRIVPLLLPVNWQLR